MKTRISAIDNDRYYANASVYAEVDNIVDSVSNEELAEMIIAKMPKPEEVTEERRVSKDSFTVDDYFGPQRWNVEGVKLNLSDSEGVYVDEKGISYIDEIIAEERGIDTEANSEWIAFCTDVVNQAVKLPPKVKHAYCSWFATDAGQKFLQAGFHEDPEDDLKESSVYSQSDMTHESYIEEMSGKEDKDESTIWDIAQKVDGGVSKEQMSFLGMNCSSPRTCTFAWGISHNPKWLLRKCKKISMGEPVWLTQELKEWMWELIKAALDETWKEELRAEMEKGKLVRVHIYPPAPKMREGFINLFCLQNGKVLSTKRICFLENEEQRAFSTLAHIEAASRAKGFIIHKSIKDPMRDSYKEGRNAFVS